MLRRTSFTTKRKPLARVSKRPENIALRKKKAKAVSTTILKDRLWQLCKKITRQIYGNTCYTCGKIGLEGANWHTGHYIPSSVCSMEMRYSLDNLRPQCYHCNIHLSGNWPAYKAHLRDEKGDYFPEWLERRNRDTKGDMYGRAWIIQKIEEYKNL